MSARIARGSPPRARPKAKAGARRKAKAPGMLDSLPLPADTIRRFSGWIFIGMILAVAIAVAAVMKVPQMAGNALGEGIGKAGFAMTRVEVKGARHVPWLQVQNIAWDQDTLAMPLIDLDYTRARLLRFGWIKEARVSRRLPGTLVVDIVERQPAAIWQHEQKLALIDKDGVFLEPVRLEAMPDLPLVIGPDANRHASELSRLMDVAPALKPQLAGATWIGGRRWDIRFQSGEVLALPEGQESAQRALTHFARMDQAAQLLGRGLVRFDMRVPGKFIVRVSREPGSTVPVVAPPQGSGAPDPATTI